MVGGLAGIPEPDAALGPDLLEIGPTVGRENKGDMVGVPGSTGGLRLSGIERDVAGVALRLIDAGRDVLAPALGLDGPQAG